MLSCPPPQSARVAVAPHGLGCIRGLLDPQSKLSQPSCLRSKDLQFRCSLRQLVLQLPDDCLPSSDTVGCLEKSLGRERGSLRRQTKLGVAVGVVLLDIVPPLDHSREVRLGGVCCEMALGLQAKPGGELSLGPSSDDPPVGRVGRIEMIGFIQCRIGMIGFV